jgi:hypothetical protein
MTQTEEYLKHQKYLEEKRTGPIVTNAGLLDKFTYLNAKKMNLVRKVDLKAKTCLQLKTLWKRNIALRPLIAEEMNNRIHNKSK